MHVKNSSETRPRVLEKVFRYFVLSLFIWLLNISENYKEQANRKFRQVLLRSNGYGRIFII